MTDKKILILKNDRVGDLFHSIKGINSIINKHKDHHIEIILSNYSKDMSFLFDIKNIETNILNYNLNIYDKLSLFKKIIVNNYDKIYILSPKNIYFYLPFFTKSKFYAICVKDFKRNRPYNFLKKKLYRFKINDRTNKRISDSISNLTENLCNDSLIKFPNILNNNPEISNLLNNNISKFNNFIYIHYKNSLFTKNYWSIESFNDLLIKISNQNKKIFLSSDFGNNNYNNFFLKKYSHINFDTGETKFDNSNITYLHNIKINDLFKVISLSDQTISPHGTMTVMASYLKKKVIDIFDITTSLNSFREFRPQNNHYNFLILKNSNDKIKNKIINFL